MTSHQRSHYIQSARRELDLLGTLNNSMRGSAERISIEELERRTAILARVFQFLLPTLEQSQTPHSR